MATKQVIVYSPVDGRIRYVVDPDSDDQLELHAQVVPNGHAYLIYHKTGTDVLHSWQLAVSQVCGKIPADSHPSVLEHVLWRCRADRI